MRAVTAHAARILFVGIPQPFQPVFRVERIIIRRNDHIIFKFLRGVEHLFKGADIVAEADVQSLFFQAEQVCRELCFLRKFLLGQPEQDTIRRTALPQDALDRQMDFPDSEREGGQRYHHPFALRCSLLRERTPCTIYRIKSIRRHSKHPVHVDLAFRCLCPWSRKVIQCIQHVMFPLFMVTFLLRAASLCRPPPRRRGRPQP